MTVSSQKTVFSLSSVWLAGWHARPRCSEGQVLFVHVHELEEVLIVYSIDYRYCGKRGEAAVSIINVGNLVGYAR